MSAAPFTASEKVGALASGRLDDVTPEEKQLLLTRLGERLVKSVLDAHRAEGAVSAPLNELHEHESLLFLGEDPVREARVRLLRARERNITRLLYDHHAWRHKHHGNVVWEFSGPTGYGKSSCMLGLLERLNGVRPEDLARHLTVEANELPFILPRLPSGSGVAVDEQTRAVGEGSVTQEKLLGNVEDQIRLSGVDIYWASPESRDHATSQGELQAFRFNPDKKYTRFLVWKDEVPLGYVNLPWCSPALWVAYQPIKRRNVDRALAATFQAGNYDEAIRALFEKPAIQACCRVRRLKVPDWRRLVKRHGHSFGTNQVQTIAEEIEFMLETLASRPEEFDTIYGWTATPAMLEAASGQPGGKKGDRIA